MVSHLILVRLLLDQCVLEHFVSVNFFRHQIVERQRFLNTVFIFWFNITVTTTAAYDVLFLDWELFSCLPNRLTPASTFEQHFIIVLHGLVLRQLRFVLIGTFHHDLNRWCVLECLLVFLFRAIIRQIFLVWIKNSAFVVILASILISVRVVRFLFVDDRLFVMILRCDLEIHRHLNGFHVKSVISLAARLQGWFKC